MDAAARLGLGLETVPGTQHLTELVGVRDLAEDEIVGREHLEHPNVNELPVGQPGESTTMPYEVVGEGVNDVHQPAVAGEEVVIRVIVGVMP